MGVSALALLGFLWAIAAFPYVMAGFALFYAFSVLTTVAHELGHVAAARAVGYEVDGIIIGSERTLWKGRLLGVPTELRMYPFGGLAYASPTDFAAARARAVFVSAAGPLVNAGLALAALPLLAFVPAGRTTAATVIQIFVITNGWQLLLSLVPYRITIDGRRVWTDGGTILALLLGSQHALDRRLVRPLYARCVARHQAGDYAGACTDGERLWAALPEQAAIGVALAYMYLDADQLAAATALCTQLLGRGDLDARQTVSAHHVMAVAHLLSGDDAQLAEAGRCSAAACSGDDVEPRMRLTHASILIARGESAEGVQQLRPLLAPEGDDAIRAAAQSSLAIGLAQLGDGAGARDALAAVDRAHVHRRWLARVDAAVAAAS